MKFILPALLMMALHWSGISQTTIPLTKYENSEFLETDRFEATIQYCKTLDSLSESITYKTFGKSPRGNELPLLILDKDGYSDPSKIHSTGRLIVLIQACIHPGECEGKDAGILLFRNFILPEKKGNLQTPDAKILDKISVVLIPVFNVDGLQRFGPFNRINQNGPKETGWRTTSQNLNLNRDYLKADTPEMQAWLSLFNQWIPDFFIDSHTTDGADYQYVLTYGMELNSSLDANLTRFCREKFIPEMEKTMRNIQEPVFPYVSFRNWHDPRSGLISEVSPPMLSQSYTANRNRPGLLIETHMLKPYRQRVTATYDCFLTSLQILSENKPTYQLLVRSADQTLSSGSFPWNEFPLTYKTSMADSIMTDFLGFEYSVERSDLTGGDWFHYTDKPITFRLPLFSSAKPEKVVRLPLAYIIPPEWETVIQRLKLHGIKMQYLVSPANLKVSTCRFTNPKWQQNPYEGRHPLINITYTEAEEPTTFPAGSAVIETCQPAARIIAHLLEPDGNGSFLYWGFFDPVFEQKEYGESYVIERLAREMIQADPSLKPAFEAKLKSDSKFAESQRDIINWFYNQSKFADPKRMVYPVGKIYNKKDLESLLKSSSKDTD